MKKDINKNYKWIPYETAIKIEGFKIEDWEQFGKLLIDKKIIRPRMKAYKRLSELLTLSRLKDYKIANRNTQESIYANMFSKGSDKFKI